MSFAIDETKLQKLMTAGTFNPLVGSENAGKTFYTNSVGGVSYDDLSSTPRVPGLGAEHIVSIASDFDDTLEVAI